MISLFTFKERAEINSLKKNLESLKKSVGELESSVKKREELVKTFAKNKKFRKLAKEELKSKKEEHEKHKRAITQHEAKIKHLENRVHEIHKEAEKIIPIIVLIAVFSIFGAYIFTERLGLTGLIVGEELETYTINVNEVYTENSEYTFAPEGPMHSVSVSGSIIGNGAVKIYLTDGTTTYLVLDSTEKGLGTVTGMVTEGEEDKKAEKEEAKEEKQEEKAEKQEAKEEAKQEAPQETPQEPEPAPEQPAEEQPVEEPQEETPIEEEPAEEPEQLPEEEIPVEEPEEQPEETPAEEPELNETVEPEINISEAPEENITEEIEENITEEVNETSNITEEPEEPPMEEETPKEEITYFSDICIETCLLPDLEINNYTLLIEIVNATLELDTITYTTPVEANVSANETANITINETVNETLNITINESINLSINETINITLNETNITLPIINLTGNITGNITNTTEEILTRVTINGPVIFSKKIKLASPANNITVTVPKWATDFNVTNITLAQETLNVSELGGEEQEEAVINETTESGLNISVNETEEQEETTNETQAPEETEPLPVEEGEENEEINEEEIEIAIITEEPPEDLGILTGEVTLEQKEDVTSLWDFIAGFFDWLSEGAITGRVVENVTINETFEDEQNITLQIITEEPVEELTLEYQMPGPTAVEEEVTSYKKRMVVSSEIHYENILSYMQIPEAPIGSVKLYWLEETIVTNNETVNATINITNQTVRKVDVTDDPDYNVTFYDTDNDTLVDWIEWNIPHLSNESFEVTITILNVQSYPIVGGNWTVRFNTTGEANLSIMAFNGTKWYNVTANETYNETIDLEFLKIMCGNETLNYTWIKPLNDSWVNSTVFISNYTCNATGYEISKVFTTGKHHIKFEFGDQVAYAHNLAGTDQYDLAICYENSTGASRVYCKFRNATTGSLTLSNSNLNDTTYVGQVHFACNPQGDECALLTPQGRATSTDALEIAYYNVTGNSWFGDANLSNDLDTAQTNKHSGALAYEPTSGDLLVAYGTDGEANITYRTKARGSTLSGESMYGDGMTGDVNLVYMYPDYHNSGDNIMVIVETDSSNVSGMRWNGTAFVNKTSLEIKVENANAFRNIDITYVPATNQYWFAWCDDTDTSGGAEIRGFDRDTNAWTNEEQQPNTGDECKVVAICGHQTDDKVTVCTKDAVTLSPDINCNIYDVSGDSWVGNVEVETAPLGALTTVSVDCAWESDNDFGVIVYDGYSQSITYRNMTSAGVGTTEKTGDSVPGYATEFFFVEQEYGDASGELVLLVRDSVNNVNIDIWNESSNSWLGDSLVAGGVTIPAAGNVRLWGTYIHINASTMEYENPVTTLESPSTGYATNFHFINLSCNATDNIEVKNLTLYTNITGSWAANETVDIGAASGSVTFNLSNLSNGNYKWNCLAMDLSGNSDWAAANFTFTINNTYRAYEHLGIPSSPFDYDSEANKTNYIELNASDNSRWNTTLADADGEYDAQIFIFNMSEDITDMNLLGGLNITWEGYGENGSTYKTNISFWNWTGSKWYLVNSTDFTSAADLTKTQIVSSSLSNFVNSTTEQVAVMVITKKYVAAPSCGGYSFGGYCWYKGNAGQNCNTVCTTHGGCVAGNWDDSDTCTVCNNFFFTSECYANMGDSLLPAYDTANDICISRGATSQDCSASNGLYARVCACTNSPFVYTYKNNNYKKLSDFIAGATSKESEYTSYTDITNTEIVDNKIKLKITEELDETTYLDNYQLVIYDYPAEKEQDFQAWLDKNFERVNDHNLKQTIFAVLPDYVETYEINEYNQDASTLYSDDKYLVMEKGFEKEIDFYLPALEKDFSRKIFFAAEGYYIEHYKVEETKPHRSLFTDYINLEAEPLGCGNTVAVDYTLTENLSCTGSGLTVGADDITIDCNGYTINYGAGGSSGYGIDNSGGYDNVTIQNCNIVEGSASGNNKYGIYFSGAQNSTIDNNNITTVGATGYAMYITSSSKTNTISNNDLDVEASGIYVGSSSNSTKITTNTITKTSEQEDKDGIYISSSSSTNITGNTFTITNALDGTAIYATGSTGTIMKSNTITVDGDVCIDECGPAIYILSSSNSNIIEDNEITYNNGKVTKAILISSSSSSNLTNNTINSTNGTAIYLDTSSTNKIRNNTINISSSGYDAFYIYSNSDSNLLQGNTITRAGQYGINLLKTGSNYPENNNITDNTFSNIDSYDLIISAGINGTWLIDQNINDYSIGGAGGKIYFKNSTAGQIKFLERINGTGVNLSAEIYIRDNLIHVNGTNTKLNKTGNITVYNLDLNGNPTIFRNGAACPSNVCGAITSNGSHCSFNVTGFSNYSVEDLCGDTITSSTTLEYNLSCNTTGIVIGANNIELDCAGYTINYSLTDSVGYAIDNSGGYDNVTIKNCVIYDGNTDETASEYAIYFSGAQNGTIDNNTLTIAGDSGYAIYLKTSSNGNTVTDNTITTTSVSGRAISLSASTGCSIADNTITTDEETAHGISLVSSSNSNNITRNTITTNGAAAFGIYLYASTDSNITHNNITTSDDGAFGIYFASSSNSNNVSYNNVTTTGATGYGVRLSSSSNTLVRKNILNTSGTSIYATSSNSNNITNNTVTASGEDGIYVGGTSNRLINNTLSEFSSYGIQLNSASQATVTTNNITSSTGSGIVIAASSNNNVSSNTINVSDSSANALYLYDNSDTNVLQNNNITEAGGHAIKLEKGLSTYPENNNFTSNTFSNIGGKDLQIESAGINGTWLIDQNINDYNISGAGSKIYFKNSTAGQIKFRERINGTGVNLSAEIYIRDNLIHVNGTNTKLNKSANISFLDVSITGTPRPFRNGAECSDTVCTDFGNDGTNYYFNVTGFSNYSLEDVCEQTLTASKTLTYDYVCDATAFIIGANSITLDCDNHYINYSTTGTLGYGVDNSGGYDGITIQDCRINEGSTTTHYKYAVYFSGGTDSVIYNNNITTIAQQSYAIYLKESSDSNNITNNNITTTGNIGMGLHITDSSNQNVRNNIITTEGLSSEGYYASISSYCNITNNTITTAHDTAFYLNRCSNNNISNNTISTSDSSSDAFYLYKNSNDNIIQNNNVTQAGRHAINLDAYTVDYPENNNFTSNTFSSITGKDLNIEDASISGTWLIDQNINDYEIEGAGSTINFKNTTAGTIEFTTAISGSGTNLSREVQIHDNNIYVNGTHSTLNKSADLTFYDVTIQGTPKALRNGAACAGTVCGAITVDGDDYSYSVTGFTNYSVGNVSCGDTITSSTNLTGNLTCDETALIMGADDITLDCKYYTLTYSVRGSGDGINNGGGYDGITIQNCNIEQYDKSEQTSAYAVYFSGAENGTIDNNNITTFTDASGGVYLNSSSNSNTITDNTITTQSPDVNGIRVTSSNSNNISNNNISAICTEAELCLEEQAIYLFSSNSTTIEDNTLTTNSEGSEGHGILLNSSSNSNIKNNTINASNSALYVYGDSDSNVFENNNLIYSQDPIVITSSVVEEKYPDNNNFTNNTILVNSGDYDISFINCGCNGTWLIDQEIGPYSIVTSTKINIKNSTAGIIQFTEGISGTDTNLSQDIYIHNNQIHVDGSKAGLNKSANLTFYSISVGGTEQPFRNGAECPDTICQDFSNEGTTYYYSVTGFSNYSIGNLSCEATITQSTNMTADLTCPETAIIIGADDITLDCQYYTITYGTSSTPAGTVFGINNTGGYDGVTIQNCNLVEGNDAEDGKNAISLAGAENGTIYNNNITTIGNLTVGIYLVGASNSTNISNNNITASGVNSYGIELTESGSNNLTSNTITTAAGIAVAMGFSSNNNRVISNTIDTGASHIYSDGFSLLETSNNNLFENNNLIQIGNDAIQLDGVSNNNFTNNTFSNVEQKDLNIISAGNNGNYFIDQNINKYNMAGAGSKLYFKNTTAGIIKFTTAIKGSGNNLSKQIQIHSNRIYVNGTNTNLNKSANLTLYDVTVTGTAAPYRNGNLCPDTICGDLTIDGDDYSYTVTHFTNYSVGNNTAPTLDALNLTPLTPTTTDDLLVNATCTDADAGNTVTAYFELYKDGVNQTGLAGSTVVTSGENTLITTVDDAETAKGEKWYANIKCSDGREATEWTNTSNVTIANTAPEAPTLLIPTENNLTVHDRTPTFNWTAPTDIDNDPLTYNIVIWSDTGCNSDRNVSGIDDANYTPTLELCTADEVGGNELYFWKVKANDGTANSTWSDTWNFSIEPWVVINVTQSTINFGSMSLGEINDTTDDDPEPFILQNDGNVLADVVNVTTNASLWQSNIGALGTQYFQIKAGNSTDESESFNWTASTTDWANVTDTNQSIIHGLNYSDTKDEVELEVRLEVPGDEPPGSKTGYVIFWWEQTP